MLSAKLAQPGRFDLVDAPPPEPADGQVVVRVHGCGLCASNLGPWSGIQGISYPLDPGAPGHEVYGTVAALGPGVDGGLREGDPVTALTYNGFAEYDVADASNVVPLPPALAARPVLGEPVACAVNVFRRSAIQPDDTVVVVGIGFLGALLVRLARRAEPARVIAVSRREESLEMASAMGADALLHYDDDVPGVVRRLTGGDMADVVIEATGKQAPLDLAGELVRVRGRLVIAGYHQDGPRTVNMQSWNWRGIDVINAHERDERLYGEGMREGVRLIADGELDLAPLISHEYPLHDINEAFAAASDRPSGFFKAVIASAAS